MLQCLTQYRIQFCASPPSVHAHLPFICSYSLDTHPASPLLPPNHPPCGDVVEVLCAHPRPPQSLTRSTLDPPGCLAG